ncbi:hypothetical protein [Flavobacterium sp.]|uniref:hypothetical protein n=1 Tax=Flavobacterium sp. TaxID=239 RepID=UPI002C17B75C|nr:hypothetical protein [Flavobacterium sp.]HSD08880.1 hypothetical protein [Flavobacterium sp.]
MKTIKTVLLVAFLVLSANTISAQYYNNGYGGGYGGGYGNGYGRSNQIPQAGDNQQIKPKVIPVEETAAKIVAFYKKELNLDALQEVVVNNIYVKSLKKEEILMKKEISDDEKKEEYKILTDMTEMEIKQILNKDQKEKFKILIDERNSKMEARKH